MEIQFLGAAQTVTGSMHLINFNGTKILLDCGLFQGKRSEAYERNKKFPFEVKDVAAVLLSHAHIDHAGNLPNLVKNGFNGPIYSTNASLDLCNIMLYDSAMIQERDIEYINRKKAKKNEPPVEPLYGVLDVTNALSHFVGVNYGKWVNINSGIRFKYIDAGHILGSAVTIVEFDYSGKKLRIGFTGDLGRKNLPIIKDPEPIDWVDILIMESTYGGKLHDPIEGMKDSLCNVIKTAVNRGGKVIIPSFSVGRTQEIVYVLSELFDEGRLPVIPIYVDSPLAVNASDIFRIHEECFDEATLKHIRANEDPFGFNRLIYIRTVEESKQLNSIKSSCVIISASGMCEGGRIVHHLANNIEDSRNIVLFVGYQAENTLGRKLVDGATQVSIFGDIYDVKAEIITLNSFSAHADQKELVEYVSEIENGKPEKIFLVHGEYEQSEALLAKLRDSGFKSDIYIPERGDKFEL